MPVPLSVLASIYGNLVLYHIINCVIAPIQSRYRANFAYTSPDTRTPLREHITPILHQLHWLPLEARINFKILVLTFKCIHYLAPPYLCDLLHITTASCSLRSSSAIHLVLSARLVTMGNRAFSHAAPRL